MKPIFYGDSSKTFWKLIWMLPCGLFDVGYTIGVKLQNFEWKLRHISSKYIKENKDKR